MRADTGVAGAPHGEPGAAPTRGERPLWQIALAAWLAQRLLLAALVLLWQALLGLLSPTAFFRVWTLYDARFYTSIARAGYHLISQAAFFPLYPLLMRLSAPLVGGDVTLAGLLLANLCALGALLLLAQLVAREFGRRAAQRALLYYAIFPTGFYLAAEYTEGLFLLLSVATFLCLRQRRWLLSGALIALATLTRAPGALLLLPLLIEAWRALRPRWAALGGARRRQVAWALAGAVALPPLALLAFQVYLAQAYGRPDIMSLAANQPLWARYLDWPWTGAVIDINSLTGANGYPQAFGLRFAIVKDLLFFVFWLGLSVIMLLPARFSFTPRLPASWVAYSWAALLQVSLLPNHNPGFGLMSYPRFALVMFPCIVLMALISLRSPRAQLVLFALCVAWTIILVRLMAAGEFVG